MKMLLPSDNWSNQSRYSALLLLPDWKRTGAFLAQEWKYTFRNHFWGTSAQISWLHQERKDWQCARVGKMNKRKRLSMKMVLHGIIWNYFPEVTIVSLRLDSLNDRSVSTRVWKGYLIGAALQSSIAFVYSAVGKQNYAHTQSFWDLPTASPNVYSGLKKKGTEFCDGVPVNLNITTCRADYWSVWLVDWDKKTHRVAHLDHTLD